MKSTEKITARVGRISQVLFAIVAMGMFTGCATVPSASARHSDPARFIHRQCPVERVETEEQYEQAVKNGPEWKGGKVWVIGECTFDSRAIKSWAEAQGIKCRIASTAAYYGRRKIANGHWTVIPEGDRYTVDYIENIGVVSRRIRSEDEFVFVEEGKNDHEMLASTRVVSLPGKGRPVRSVDFTTVPPESLRNLVASR